MSILTQQMERHRELVQQLNDSAEPNAKQEKPNAEQVKDFIGELRALSPKITTIGDRDDLRSTLLYWATYLTSIDEEWPDIDTHSEGRRPNLEILVHG